MASLLDALKQYIGDAMPGGSLNQEQPTALSGLLDYGKKRVQYIGGLLDPQSQISQDAQNWHKRTQLGLADQLAGRQTPAAEQAYQTLMGMAGIAPIGITAWHGSPHKFDKFSLDKIGTGEGAQAYGHGLYLAESPEVAKQYSRMGRVAEIDGVPVTGKGVKASNADAAQKLGINQSSLDRLALSDFDVQKTLNELGSEYASAANHGEKAYVMQQIGDIKRLMKSNVEMKSGEMYKTDIPDEAVARFLDWDKPLSQQAPEVQKALHDHVPTTNLTGQPWPEAWDMIAGDFIKQRSYANGNGDIEYSLLNKGIPGIRYLDGGSRGAGNGTSNFVSFSPDLIRILERNGIPTGEQPWKPGEWVGK